MPSGYRDAATASSPLALFGGRRCRRRGRVRRAGARMGEPVEPLRSTYPDRGCLGPSRRPEGRLAMRIVRTYAWLLGLTLLLVACPGGLPAAPPQVTIVGLVDGQIVVGSREIVVAGSLDANADIVAVEATGVAVVATDFDQTSFSVTVELADGPNTVVVTAEDDEGGVGSSLPLNLTYPFVSLPNFHPASQVIGQADFTSTAPNQGGAVAADTARPKSGAPFLAADGPLFLPDGSNNRVLGYDALPASDGADADFVLGQPDFASDDVDAGPTRFEEPSSVHSDGTILAVADNDNSRVLIWNTVPTATETPADVVVGHLDFAANGSGCDAASLSAPGSAMVVAGRLIVADSFNNRVLIYHSIPTANGAEADVVLGQGGFTTCEENDDDQDGADDGAPSARTLNDPTGVWSDGERLVVADRGNHRVLIWETLPSADFTPADVVLGQPGFVSAGAGLSAARLSEPQHAFSNGNQLFVVDGGNHRIVIHDSFPTTDGRAADRVLGQTDLTHGAANDVDQDGIGDKQASASTLASPVGVFVRGDELIVTDQGNHRFLVYRAP